MEKLRFYDFMRAGHVKRWHIVNTTREQTIAEHQYLVTIIAMELWSRLTGVKVSDPAGRELFLALIIGAMFHDAPEVRYGDFPSPAKRHIREITRADFDDVFESLDRELMPDLPYVGGQLTDGRIPDVIRMADAIESAHWISEHKAGTHAEAVARGNSRRMAEMVAELSSKTGVDWFEPVNAVLMELGMPYISKAMMVTPP